MLDDETRSLVEAGSATIVGTVDDHGMPHACRGWGVDVLDDATAASSAFFDRSRGVLSGQGTEEGADGLVVRVLVDAHDEVALANLAPGRPVAVTATDVPTLRSVQLKGVAAGTSPGGRAELERMRRFCDGFYTDIETTDGTPRDIVERLTPDAVVAVLVDVHEVFDQTPGPVAGRSLRWHDDEAPGGGG